MSLTAEEKLEANLNVLQRLKRPISTETSGECLRHNVLRVPLQELVLRTEMCSVCLAQVSVEAIIKADNALPCPGMLKGNKCDQVHGYSFCREIMYSQDVGEWIELCHLSSLVVIFQLSLPNISDVIISVCVMAWHWHGQGPCGIAYSAGNAWARTRSTACGVTVAT
mmetsp:Transcript_30570/g.58933  ORF Transcript_30570/g.58933 Transcript_30570/m.58933 type:complete len:167 (-) Transcript_30570:430-930(-)